MRHEFSFDVKSTGAALKIGVLTAVIFISADFGSRQGADLLVAAAKTAAYRNASALPLSAPKSKSPPVATSTFISDMTANTASSGAYFRKTNLPANVPIVEGAGAIAVDLETGAVLFEKNRDDMYPTASVAKLMTAVIAQETLASSTVITAGADAVSTYGNSGGIVRGESFRVQDLLYGLLLPWDF